MDWARILGGMKKYLAEYARSFGAAGFSRQKDLYIASGLLSYNASAEMQDMLRFLGPHSRSVQYKEKYLPPEVLAALNPEQQALVDFLVLANSDNFVGLGSSTFSVYLRCVLCAVVGCVRLVLWHRVVQNHTHARARAQEGQLATALTPVHPAALPPAAPVAACTHAAQPGSTVCC